MVNRHMKKVLNVVSNQENKNQDHNEISHTLECLLLKRKRQQGCWQGCGEERTLIHCWWECKLVQPLRKQHGGFANKNTTAI